MKENLNLMTLKFSFWIEISKFRFGSKSFWPFKESVFIAKEDRDSDKRDLEYSSSNKANLSCAMFVKWRNSTWNRLIKRRALRRDQRSKRNSNLGASSLTMKVDWA